MAITRSNKSMAKSQKKTQSTKSKKVKVNVKKNTKQKTKKQVTVRGQKNDPKELPVKNVSIDSSKAGAVINNDMNTQNENDFKVEKDISNQDKNYEDKGDSIGNEQSITKKEITDASNEDEVAVDLGNLTTLQDLAIRLERQEVENTDSSSDSSDEDDVVIALTLHGLSKKLKGQEAKNTDLNSRKSPKNEASSKQKEGEFLQSKASSNQKEVKLPQNKISSKPIKGKLPQNEISSKETKCKFPQNEISSKQKEGKIPQNEVSSKQKEDDSIGEQHINSQEKRSKAKKRKLSVNKEIENVKIRKDKNLQNDKLVDSTLETEKRKSKRQRKIPTKYKMVSEDTGNSKQPNFIKTKKDTSIQNVETAGCIEETGTRKSRRTRKIPTKNKVCKDPLILKDFNEVLKKVNNNTNLNEQERKHWQEFLKNSQQKFFTNGKLFEAKNSESNFQLDVESFLSLVCKNKELEGEVIDFLISLHVKNEQVQFLKSYVCKTITNKYLREDANISFEEDKNWLITVYNQDLDDNVEDGNKHWIFLMFDKQNKILYIIDPLENHADKKLGKNILSWFSEVLNRSTAAVEPNPESAWVFDKEWSIKTIDHSLQKDGTSCGLFCVEYALEILKNISVLPAKINVDSSKNGVSELRMKNTAIILNHSNTCSGNQ